MPIADPHPIAAAAPGRACHSGFGRERGAALLTAMMIVTLVSTLAATMVWQQWRAIQVEAAERSRAQSAWILQGALDWSRLILREDARSGGSDHLGEPWAVPLAEARLSTFLAADRDRTDDSPEAFLSGRIEDAQARFNLRNLVDGATVSVPDVNALRRLCETAGVPPSVAQAMADGLLRAQAVPAQAQDSAEQPSALAPQTVDQFAWMGIDAEHLRQLDRYVVLLPVRTTLNLNTAAAEVLAAVVDKLDRSSAERLAQARQRNPFRDLAAAQSQLPSGVTLNAAQVGVASSFFEIRGRLRLEERVLEERSLVRRQGLEMVPLSRERISSVEAD